MDLKTEQCILQAGQGFPHTGKPCKRCHFGPCPVRAEREAKLKQLLEENRETT